MIRGGCDPKMVRIKLLAGVLAVSLAGNFLAGGFILGGHLNFGPVRAGSAAPPTAPDAAAAGQANWGQKLARLPQQERQRFIRAMQPTRQELRPLRESLQAPAEAVAAALTAEPYDPERMRQAFAALRERNGALQERLQDAQADALGALSLESRRELAAPTSTIPTPPP